MTDTTTDTTEVVTTNPALPTNPAPKMLRIFKNTQLNSNYITTKGKQLNFLNGRHLTDNTADIKELQAEVDAGNPHIYVDPLDTEVDSKLVDPMEALKAKIRAELLEEQARESNAIGHISNTDSKPLLSGIANSSTIASGAADSDSTTTGASASTTDTTAAQTAQPSIADKLAALKAAP